MWKVWTNIGELLGVKVDKLSSDCAETRQTKVTIQLLRWEVSA